MCVCVLTVTTVTKCISLPTCAAINECAEGTNNCEQLCSDTGSSFECSCNNGYTLEADGAACNGKKECCSSSKLSSIYAVSL